MPMRTRAAIAAFITALLTGCSSAPQQSAAGGLPPVPVSIAEAAEEAVPIQVDSIGTVESSSTVEVKAQVPGPLIAVRFNEGANVNRGDLLFEIDSRPFREALRQAEAAVMKDEAQLRVAEANVARTRAQLKNAKAEQARFEQLSKEGISTRQQDDQIRTAAEVAEHSVRGDEATIESIRAALESDRSAVEQAKLNLTYCEIHAPISGRVGNLLLHPGNLVKANGDNPLVVINQIAPIFVTFGIPERYLGEISRLHAQHKIGVTASPEKNFKEAAHGMLSVIDNAVDPNTGTIRLKATFDNKESRLWPGQFVNILMTLETQKATIIPSEAIQAGQNGSFVYVVKSDQSVEPRPVVVGQTVSGKVIVEQGVAAGETVVTDGQSRLFPGAKISTSK
jgi:multidrug efflux system membrane fusion protein